MTRSLLKMSTLVCILHDFVEDMQPTELTPFTGTHVISHVFIIYYIHVYASVIPVRVCLCLPGVTGTYRPTVYIRVCLLCYVLITLRSL